MQIASLHNSFYSSEEECFRFSESIGTELLPVEEYRDCMFHRAGDLQPQLRRSARLSHRRSDQDRQRPSKPRSTSAAPGSSSESRGLRPTLRVYHTPSRFRAKYHRGAEATISRRLPLSYVSATQSRYHGRILSAEGGNSPAFRAALVAANPGFASLGRHRQICRERQLCATLPPSLDIQNFTRVCHKHLGPYLLADFELSEIRHPAIRSNHRPIRPKQHFVL